MNEQKPSVLALSSAARLDRAAEGLYDVGLREGDVFETTTVQVGSEEKHAIRAVADDREVLGDIAKQLVIVGIPFRVVRAQ